MAKDGEIDVGFGLDTSQANTELRKLKDQLESITSSLVQTQGTIETRLKNMTADITKAMSKMKDGSAELLRAQRRLEGVTGQQLASASRGGKSTQVTTAAARSIIAESKASADQITAEITNALVGQFSQRLRTMTTTVSARLKKELASVDQLIANNTDEMIRATTIVAERRRRLLLAETSDPRLYAAQDSLRARRNSRTIADASNGSLLDAQDAARAQRQNRLIEQVNDLELQQAEEKLRRLRRISVIERANDEEGRALRKLASEERKARLTDRANDEELKLAEQKLREIRRTRTIETANDDEGRARRKAEKEARVALALEKAQDEELLAAQARLAAARRDRTIARANAPGVDPTVAAARTTLAGRRDQDAIYEATYGRGSAANRNTLERLGSNGGADILAVQSKLLMGYTSLSVMFNSLRGLSTFIVELDKEMRNFQAITATTNSEMVTLRRRLIDASEATRFTALEIAQAATIMGQAGFSAREVSESIEAVSKLATASGTDLAASVDVVTSAMSIFNLQTSEATNVANTLTAALNLSKLTIDKIALGLQYSGQTAAQMGVGFGELTASLGALANSGVRSGSTLGTGLRQLLIDLQTPSEKFLKILKQIGLTQEDINVESQGLLPVLANLRDAGFGASDAFQSLEVRAASAYLSLSANTTLAADLQKQFILSNAAAEANEIQMGSLANTFARFQSVVGTVVGSALDPFLAVLQKVLSAAADTLAVFNDYPGVLQVLGVAVTAIATGITANLVVSLVRAIPLMLGFGAAATGVATATTAANGALGVMFALFRANPLVLAVSAISAVAVAFEIFGKNAIAASQRVDMLKGQVNQLAGEADTTRGQIEAIDQAMTNLIKQKEALDKNPVMREARILELIQQFKDLAGTVSSTTSTVDDLMNALRNLRNIDLDKMSSDLSAAIAADDALIAGQQTLLSEQRGGASDTMMGAISTIIDNSSRRDRMVTAANTGNDKQLIADAAATYGQLFGAQFGDYARMALDPSAAFPTDANQANIISNNISSRLSQLNQQQDILGTRKALGQPMTAAEVDALARIPGQLSMLETLRDAIAPLVSTTTNISATEFDKATKVGDRLKADVQRDGGYKQLLLDAQQIEQQVTTSFRNINRNSSNMTADQLVQAYSSLKAQTDAQVDALEKRADRLVTTLSQQMGVQPGDIRGALNDVTTPLAGVRGSLTAKLEEQNVALAKLTSEQLGNTIDTIDRAIAATKDDAKDAVTNQEIEVIKDFIRKQLDKKRQLTADIFNAKMNATDDQTEKQNLAAELREKQRQINIAEQDAMSDLSQQQTSLRISQIEAEKKIVDQQISATEKRLTDLLEVIRKTTPGATLDKLVAQFNALAAALNSDQLRSGMLDLQAQSAAQLTPKQAERGAYAMNYLMQNGNMSQVQASGLVGRLLVESGLDVNAIGDRGQARGIAQWHADRQATFKGDWSSLDDQLNHIIWEMANTEKDAGGMLRSAQTPQDAVDAAMAYERPQNYTKANPQAGIGYLNTYRYALALGQNDYAGNAADASGRNQDLNAALTAGQLKAAKVANANTVKAAQQQIETLIAQSKGLNDPELVKSIITSVNDQYKRIVDAKTKAFDAENPNSEDPEVAQQRQDLIESLQADQNQNVSTLLNTYWDTLDRKLQEPVTTAQATLNAASAAGNDNNFTGAQLQDLNNNVVLAERARLVEREAAARQVLLEVQKQLAMADDNTRAFWLNEEAQAVERLAEATREKNAQDQAATQQAPAVEDAIRSATQAWLQQQGAIDSFTGQVIPLAKQVEDAWGGVLDGLQSGFSTLFTDLASGTMSAGDAFKKFGVSVLDTFTQIIAKALATQVVMQLMGGGVGGGDIWSSLFGIPGQKLGGMVTAKGAALGEGIPGRDSVLRKLMPGEYVLRQSAVSAIGAGNLDALNNLGNRRLSNGIQPMLPTNDNQGGGDVNVWVVTPDQMPAQMGPSDVIATVADNLQRRGSLKQLVQTIARGG